MFAVMLVGVVIGSIAGIWLLIEAFRVSILWGLASIFIPLVPIIFVILHWDRARKPFLWSLLGTVLIVVPSVIQAHSMARQAALEQVTETTEP